MSSEAALRAIFERIAGRMGLVPADIDVTLFAS